MPDALEVKPVDACPDCGATLASTDLSCPNCQRLIHAEALKKIAQEAEFAATNGDLTAALTLWRQALDLLPAESNQYSAIQQKIIALSRKLDESPKAAPQKKNAGIFGAISAAFIFLLTKGKFLLLGLGKAKTFFSMILALGVYWAAWGWQFALGFVLCIYIHEMGHVAALHRYGIPATPPMFIPGLGAFIRSKQYPATPSEDAYVGLAGPVWGLGATIITYLIFLYTGSIFFAALTHISALINFFNLAPLGSLDGGRGFRALTGPQRFFCTLSVAAAWYFSQEGIAVFVLLFAVFSLFGEKPAKPDHRACAKYVVLVAALMTLSVITEPLALAGLRAKTGAANTNAAQPEQPEGDTENE